MKEWLSKPPNSPTLTKYAWDKVFGGFPAYFRRETPLSVLEEPMKMHPIPEEDVESFLFSPNSPAATRLLKEKLAPILRTSSILLWNKTKREYVSEKEKSGIVSTKTDLFFSTLPTPTISQGKSAEDTGKSRKFMIDAATEMYLPAQLGSSDSEYFIVL